MDKQLLNVILLGLAFFFIFLSFQTSVFIQQTVVNSIRTKPEYNFHGDGYISLCITYIVFAISNWLSPSIIGLTGAKYGMFFAAMTYALYSASFIYPTTLTFYLAAVLIGMGAGPLWAAQGNYLADNSDSETSGRNAGLFWAIFQSSILFGNIFVYVAFNNKTTISDETRFLVYGVLTSLAVVGIFILLLLRQKSVPLSVSECLPGPWKQFKGALKLSATLNMILLTIVFLFTGQLLTFFSGIYGTALGATWQFGPDAKKYIGLSGAFIGLGEIFGGAVFGLMGSKLTKCKLFKRECIFLLGTLIGLVAYALVYFNLPPDSPLVPRAETDALMMPRIWIAMVAAGLLGLADACYNTQVLAMLMSLYSDNSLAAFALYKFSHSIGAAITFLYSTKLNLYHQLYLLAAGSILATLAFWIVEVRERVRCRKSERLESSTNHLNVNQKVHDFG